MKNTIYLDDLSELYDLCEKENTSFGDEAMQNLFRAQAIIKAREISFFAFGSHSYADYFYRVANGISGLFGNVRPLLRLFDEQGLLTGDDCKKDTLPNESLKTERKISLRCKNGFLFSIQQSAYGYALEIKYGETIMTNFFSHKPYHSAEEVMEIFKDVCGATVSELRGSL